MTTLITPWGSYRYRRTPIGHCSASDAYTRRFDATILYSASVKEAFWDVYALLAACARAGVTLKPEKFSFCKREVDFVSFRVDWKTLSACQTHCQEHQVMVRAGQSARSLSGDLKVYGTLQRAAQETNGLTSCSSGSTRRRRPSAN